MQSDYKQAVTRRQTSGTSIKEKIGVRLFCRFIYCSRFFLDAADSQFEEEVRSICFTALIWTRRLTAPLFIASMRSSRAISFLKSSNPTIVVASKKDPSTGSSQRSSDGNFLLKCSFRFSERRGLL